MGFKGLQGFGSQDQSFACDGCSTPLYLAKNEEPEVSEQ